MMDETSKVMYQKNTNNLIVAKSKSFAVRIIKLYQYLDDGKRVYPIAKQILRSRTSIGANVKEAIRGQSRADFVSKMNIALKEASETEYWLELLYETGYLNAKAFSDIYSDCQEIIRILTSIIKTTKKAIDI